MAVSIKRGDTGVYCAVVTRCTDTDLGRTAPKKSISKTPRYCFSTLLIILFIVIGCCAGCGDKGKSEYEVNGMTFDFNGQPYLVANVRGTVVSVESKGESTEAKIRLQKLELMQKAGEEEPKTDYQNREIVVEIHRPPQGLEAGKTIDASIRIVHTDKDVKFLGISVKVT